MGVPDHNRLSTLTTSNPVPRLRVLRLSDNRLCQMNVAQYPNLRTLYMDGNRLTGLTQMIRLSKLENLSLRNQRGGQL
jgi:protein NUD1